MNEAAGAELVGVDGPPEMDRLVEIFLKEEIVVCLANHYFASNISL